jgi:hypothetical protein
VVPALAVPAVQGATAPQNWPLELGSTHDPLQMICPGLQLALHCPPVHTVFGGHCWPPTHIAEAPQNWLLVSGLMHCPIPPSVPADADPQRTSPGVHTSEHLPVTQCSPDGHAVPHAPAGPQY